MTDEYAIDARSFAQTLRDQRRTQMKGGLYHLNQVLMAYNSNRIVYRGRVRRCAGACKRHRIPQPVPIRPHFA